jgi:DNA-binding Lrp family transcriptional regulator
MEEFTEKIREIEEIVECYFITGEADFMMKVVCQDIPSYEKLLFQKISQIKEIERVRTLMTLSTVKSAKILPFEYN